jgi:hypothetical protein
VHALIEAMRKSLDMIPNQSVVSITNIRIYYDRSPKRSPRDAEQKAKVALLNCSQQLASASKQLVRSVQAQNVRQCLQVVCEEADATVKAGQTLLSHSPSLFRAQMLCAKVVDVLQVCARTVSMRSGVDGVRHCGGSARRRRSADVVARN